MNPTADPADSASVHASPARIRWSALVLLSGLCLAVLDATLLNVALPTIARTLRIEPAESVRIVNAYQIAVVAGLLPLASLGDHIGYRRVYVAGVVLFTAASAVCMTTGSLTMLVAARVCQGLGAAGIMSVNGALVRLTYPPHLLARGIALNSLVVAGSTAAGPTVAAMLLAVAPWPALFAVNLPIGLAIILGGWRLLPVSTPLGSGYDWVSAALSALTFGLVFTAAERLGQREFDAMTWILGVIGLVVGVLFVLRQLTRPAPLLPVDLLRIPIFALSMCTSVCSFMAQTMAFITLPFLLHDDLGYGTSEIGMIITAWPLALMCTAPLAARLMVRLSAGWLGAIGLGAMGCGLFALSRLAPGAVWWDVAWRTALCGAGFGLFQSPNNHTILTAGPVNRSGGASGMLGTARLCGQTSGAALVAWMFGTMSRPHETVLVLSAVLAAVAAVLSASRTATGRRAAAG